MLRSQYERSLSSSSATIWDAGEVERTVTLTVFAEGIGTVLRALCERPGRWILITECGPYRYRQALACEDGALVAEVISNHWIEGTCDGHPRRRIAFETLDGCTQIRPTDPTG